MPHSVLVIDDLSFYRRRLRNLLRELGYSVHEATNGAGGVDMARRLDPDIVFLDEIIPGEKAEETLRELGSAGDPHVVVLSPRADGPSARALADAGAFAVLPKTVGRDEIQSALQAVDRASAA